MSKFLEIFWAKTHNLKNINVRIPKNKMTVITWVSGSWKSSLAFNTIYNVGQQKYLESLSSYARMFIWWASEEAEVEEIVWLSPTISIDQKTTNKNPRSTLGTITEIYDYYKLLYLNIWQRFCIKCWTSIKKDSINDIIDYINSFEEWIKFTINSPQKIKNIESFKKKVLDLGFIRFKLDKEIFTINDDIKEADYRQICIIIDRLVKKDYSDKNNSDTKRLKDSIALAFKTWNWILEVETDKKTKVFSNNSSCSNCFYTPKTLTISSFSFNSHSWACEDCHWLWVKKVFLEEKIINPRLTLLEWAVIAPGFSWNYFINLIEEVGRKNNIPLNTNYSLLSEKDKKIILYWTWKTKYKVEYINDLWAKNTYYSVFEGVINTLTRRYYDKSQIEKWIYDDFVVDFDCNTCNSYRLNIESLAVKVWWLNIWRIIRFDYKRNLRIYKKI